MRTGGGSKSPPILYVGREASHSLCQLALSSAWRRRRPSSASDRSLNSRRRWSMVRDAWVARCGRHPTRSARFSAALPLSLSRTPHTDSARKVGRYPEYRRRAGRGPAPSHEEISHDAYIILPTRASGIWPASPRGLTLTSAASSCAARASRNSCGLERVSLRARASTSTEEERHDPA